LKEEKKPQVSQEEKQRKYWSKLDTIDFMSPTNKKDHYNILKYNIEWNCVK